MTSIAAPNKPIGTLNINVFAQDDTDARILISKLGHRLQGRGLEVPEPSQRPYIFPNSALQRVADAMYDQSAAQGGSVVHFRTPPAPTSSDFRDILWCQHVAELYRLERERWVCLNVLCWFQDSSSVYARAGEGARRHFHETLVPFVETYFGDNLIMLRNESGAEDLLHAAVDTKVEKLAPILASAGPKSRD